MVFPGVQKTTWTRDPKARRVLLPPLLRLPARPEHAQPRTCATRCDGSWASGCSSASPGFRIDAVPFVLEKPTVDSQAVQLDFELPARDPRLPAVAARRRGPARPRRTCCPRQAAQYFARGRRAAHDVQLLGQPAPLLRARDGRRAAAGAGAAPDARSIPQGAQWAHFLRNHDELDLGRLTDEQRERGVRARSARSRRCSSTTAASGAASRRCSATAGGSSWPTACSSRCPARRCFATATRSAWARTCACKERDGDPHADAVVLTLRTAASHAPTARFGR